MSYKEKEWYHQRHKLNFNKPIFSSREGSLEILLPVQQVPNIYEANTSDTYLIVGYDWFNLSLGCWGSSNCWNTPEEAVSERKNPYNASITILEDK